MGNNPKLSLEDAQALVEQKVLPRVTKESIEAKIQHVEYLGSNIHHQLTICIIHMENGFCVIGKAAPVYAGNYDREVGKRYAYEDAFKRLWPLEGYVLAYARAYNDSLKQLAENLNSTQ